MNSITTVLGAFHEAGDEFVSGGELRRRLNTTVHGVTQQMAELKTLGYRIESHPHRGYRLVSSPDRLLADDVRVRMRRRLIGSEILVFDETGSTNDVVAHLSRNGAREGLVVFAESQTHGRGRHGRAWASPRGKGLWFSILLRPKSPALAAQQWTVAASVAVARAVRNSTGVDARIKWPNDVMIQAKKMAGILAEARNGAVILGIGMDINCRREDFPADVRAMATSLRMETGKPHDRTALAASVLDELNTTYEAMSSDFQTIADEWARWSTTLGKHLVILVGRRRMEGYAQALDSDGALLVRKDNGHLERIVNGDVWKEQP